MGWILGFDRVVSGSYRDPDRNHEPCDSGSTWLDQKVLVAEHMHMHRPGGPSQKILGSSTRI